MNTTALALVLASALLHAVWNLLLKRARDRFAFVWWYLLVPTLLFSPMVFLTWDGGTWGLSGRSLLCGLASGVFQAANLMAMSWAYREGDLSVVYPLARGTGQALTVALGVCVLDETLSPLGALGVGLVFVGVYVVFLRSLALSDVTRPLRLLLQTSSVAALLAGVAISLYHVIDRVGMRDANPYPYVLLLFAVDFCVFTVFLAVRRRWDLVWSEWRTNKLSIAVAGSLSLISYLLVLHALRQERVAYVGPARNVGIVFSVLLGALFLREKHGLLRVLGSALIVGGLALAGLAG
ncbi:EamA family transporter [Planctomycetota bacterium]